MQRGRCWQIILLLIAVTDHNLFTEGRCRRLLKYAIYDCQAPWQLFGDYCYLYVAAPRSYSVAEQHCTTNSQPGRLAHLASVLSDKEAQFLNDMTGGQHFWIGFNDLDVEGAYTWLDGSPVNYTNWRAGFPVGDTYGNQDCIQTLGLDWKEYFCNRGMNSVCKMPRYASA